MDPWLPKGGVSATPDGAFERFLTAAIATIITIMFSWRLLDQTNDEDMREDEHDPGRRKLGFSSPSSLSSSFVSLSSPYRTTSGVAASPDPRLGSGVTSERLFHQHLGVKRVAPLMDSAPRNRFVSSGIGNKLTSLNPVIRVPVDLPLCGDAPVTATDAREALNLQPPGLQQHAGVTAINRSNSLSHLVGCFDRHHQDQIDGERRRPTSALSSSSYNSPEHSHSDPVDITDSSLEDVEVIGVDNSIDLFLNLSSDDSGDNRRDEYRQIINNDNYRPFHVPNHTTDNRTSDEDGDNFFDRHSDNFNDDDAQPRELNSEEQLFCCSVLEPISEEDSDDIMTTSDGESSRSEVGFKDVEVEYDLEYEERRRGLSNNGNRFTEKPIYSVRNSASFGSIKNSDVFSTFNRPSRGLLPQRPVTRIIGLLPGLEKQGARLTGVNSKQATRPDYETVTGSGASGLACGDAGTRDLPSVSNVPVVKACGIQSNLFPTNDNYDYSQCYGSSVDRLSPSNWSLNVSDDNLGNDSDKVLHSTGEPRNVIGKGVVAVTSEENRDQTVPHIFVESVSARVEKTYSGIDLCHSSSETCEENKDCIPTTGQSLTSGLRAVPITTKRPVSDGFVYVSEKRRSKEEDVAFFRDRIVSEGGGLPFGESNSVGGTHTGELFSDEGNLDSGVRSNFKLDFNSSNSHVSSGDRGSDSPAHGGPAHRGSAHGGSAHRGSAQGGSNYVPGALLDNVHDGRLGESVSVNAELDNVDNKRQLGRSHSGDAVGQGVGSQAVGRSSVALLKKQKPSNAGFVNSKRFKESTVKSHMNKMDGHGYYPADSSDRMSDKIDVSDRRETDEEETEWEEEIIETFVVPVSNERTILRTLQSVKDLLDQRSAARRSELIPRDDDDDEVDDARESTCVTSMIDVKGHDEVGFTGNEDVTSGYQEKYNAVARTDKDLKEKMGFELSLNEYKTDEYNTESGWPIVRYIEKERFWVDDNAVERVEYNRDTHSYSDERNFFTDTYSDTRGLHGDTDSDTRGPYSDTYSNARSLYTNAYSDVREVGMGRYGGDRGRFTDPYRDGREEGRFGGDRGRFTDPYRDGREEGRFGDERGRFTDPYRDGREEDADRFGEERGRYTDPYRDGREEDADRFGEERGRYTDPNSDGREEDADRFGEERGRYTDPYSDGREGDGEEDVSDGQYIRREMDAVEEEDEEQESRGRNEEEAVKEDDDYDGGEADDEEWDDDAHEVEADDEGEEDKEDNAEERRDKEEEMVDEDEGSDSYIPVYPTSTEQFLYEASKQSASPPQLPAHGKSGTTDNRSYHDRPPSQEQFAKLELGQMMSPSLNVPPAVQDTSLENRLVPSPWEEFPDSSRGLLQGVVYLESSPRVLDRSPKVLRQTTDTQERLVDQQISFVKPTDRDSVSVDYNDFVREMYSKNDAQGTRGQGEIHRDLTPDLDSAILSGNLATPLRQKDVFVFPKEELRDTTIMSSTFSVPKADNDRENNNNNKEIRGRNEENETNNEQNSPAKKPRLVRTSTAQDEEELFGFKSGFRRSSSVSLYESTGILNRSFEETSSFALDRMTSEPGALNRNISREDLSRSRSREAIHSPTAEYRHIPESPRKFFSPMIFGEPALDVVLETSTAAGEQLRTGSSSTDSAPVTPLSSQLKRSELITPPPRSELITTPPRSELITPPPVTWTRVIPGSNFVTEKLSPSSGTENSEDAADGAQTAKNVSEKTNQEDIVDLDFADAAERPDNGAHSPTKLLPIFSPTLGHRKQERPSTISLKPALAPKPRTRLPSFKPLKTSSVTTAVKAPPAAIPEQILQSSIPVKTPSAAIPQQILQASIPVKTPSAAIPQQILQSSIPVKTPPATIPQQILQASIPVKTPPAAIPQQILQASIPVKTPPAAIPQQILQASIPVKTPPAAIPQQILQASIPVKTPPAAIPKQILPSQTPVKTPAVSAPPRTPLSSNLQQVLQTSTPLKTPPVKIPPTSLLLSNLEQTTKEKTLPVSTPPKSPPASNLQLSTPMKTSHVVTPGKPPLAPKPRKTSTSSSNIDIARTVMPERLSPTFSIDRTETRIELITPEIQKSDLTNKMLVEYETARKEETDFSDEKIDIDEEENEEKMDSDEESSEEDEAEEEDEDTEDDEEGIEMEEEIEVGETNTTQEVEMFDTHEHDARYQTRDTSRSKEGVDDVFLQDSAEKRTDIITSGTSDSAFTHESHTPSLTSASPRATEPTDSSTSTTWAHSQFIPGSPKKPRSMKEIKKRYKQPYKSVLTQEPTTPTSPKAASFVLPESLMTPSRLKIIQSRDRFMSEQNLLSDPFAGEFAAHREAMAHATAPTKDRKYAPKMAKNNPNYRSQEQLEKLMYMINMKHGRSVDSLHKAHTDCLHDDCILSAKGRREVLEKALSIDNLHSDLYRQLQRFGSETDMDVGHLSDAYFPETNSDMFDLTFPFQGDVGRNLERPASMSELRHASDYTTISGSGSGYFDTSDTKGRGRFTQRQHKKSKSLCTLETNLDDVNFATSPTSDGLQRVPSAHELRISKSLQKLNVPNWYKQSSLSKSGSCLLKYGSNSSMSSWAISPSLISSPCTTPSSTANVVIKSRVQLPTSSRNMRSPRFTSKSAPSTPPFMNQSQEDMPSAPTPVRLPSEKMRTADKPKALMPIPIVPFDKIRAMFEKKKEDFKTQKTWKEDSPASLASQSSSLPKAQPQRPTMMSPPRKLATGDETNDTEGVIPKVIVSPTDPNVKSILKRTTQEKRYSDIQESPEADDEPSKGKPASINTHEFASVMVLSHAPTLINPPQPLTQQATVKPPIKEKPIPAGRPKSGEIKLSQTAKDESKPAPVSKEEKAPTKRHKEEERQPPAVPKSKGFAFFKSLRSSSSSSTEDSKDKERRSPRQKDQNPPTSPSVSPDSSYDSPDAAFPASPVSRLSPVGLKSTPTTIISSDTSKPKGSAYVNVVIGGSGKPVAIQEPAPVLKPSIQKPSSVTEAPTSRGIQAASYIEPPRQDLLRNTGSPESIEETNLDDSYDQEIVLPKHEPTTPEVQSVKKKSWFPKSKSPKTTKSPEEPSKIAPAPKEPEMKSKFEIQQLSDEPRRLRSPVESVGHSDSFTHEQSKPGYIQRESDRSRTSTSFSEDSRSVTKESDLDRSGDSYYSRSGDRSRESDRDYTRDSKIPERKPSVDSHQSSSHGFDRASDRFSGRVSDRGGRASEGHVRVDDSSRSSDSARDGRYSSGEEDRRGGSKDRDYDRDFERRDTKDFDRHREYDRREGDYRRDVDYNRDRDYSRRDADSRKDVDYNRDRDYSTRDADSRKDVDYNRDRDYSRRDADSSKDVDYNRDRDYTRDKDYPRRDVGNDKTARDERDRLGRDFDRTDLTRRRDRDWSSREGSFSRESESESESRRGDDAERSYPSRSNTLNSNMSRDTRVRRSSDNYEDTTASRTSLSSGRSWQPKPRTSRGSDSSLPRNVNPAFEENTRTSKPSVDSNGTTTAASSPYRYRVAGSAFSASRPNAVSGLNTPPPGRHETSPSSKPDASEGSSKSLRETTV